MRNKQSLSTNKQSLSTNRGFTLIELLVVIFIIGILAGVILPNFVSSRQRARDSRRKQDLSDVKSALRLYYNDNQNYPAIADFTFGNAFGSGGTTYMAKVPQDPLGDSHPYVYCVSTDGDGFVLRTQLENAGDSEAVDAQLDSSCPAAICVSDCTTGNCYYVCAF